MDDTGKGEPHHGQVTFLTARTLLRLLLQVLLLHGLRGERRLLVRRHEDGRVHYAWDEFMWQAAQVMSAATAMCATARARKQAQVGHAVAGEPGVRVRGLWAVAVAQRGWRVNNVLWWAVAAGALSPCRWTDRRIDIRQVIREPAGCRAAAAK